MLFCRKVTTMSLICRLFKSIDDLDLAAWERVHAECGAPIFMDPRFVGAVEISMRRSYRFWYVIVYENGSPVACACLTAMTLDLADFSDPYVASILRRLPQVLSRFRRLKVFLCGLPGLPADKALALSSPASSPKITFSSGRTDMRFGSAGEIGRKSSTRSSGAMISNGLTHYLIWDTVASRRRRCIFSDLHSKISRIIVAL